MILVSIKKAQLSSLHKILFSLAFILILIDQFHFFYIVNLKHSNEWMATRLVLLLIQFITLLTTSIFSFALPLTTFDQAQPYSYIHYRLAEDHHYRPSLVSFLHRQPDGSQLATIRYSRIVFHCRISPGSLYLRFSKLKPFRTLVQNRQDPSTIFAFRSVGAYSRIQIQNYISGLWLCMNHQGRIILKSNISVDNLGCTFRQNSDGPYVTLISELYPSHQMTFSTLHLLFMNPILRRRYVQNAFKPEQCSRFMFDNQVDISSVDRTIDPFVRLRS